MAKKATTKKTTAKKTTKTKPQEMIGKSNAMMAIVIAVLISLPGGFLLGVSVTDDEDTKTTTSESDSHSSKTHEHEMFEAAGLNAIPEITDLEVTKDAKSGWNISFDTNNFVFAPQNASQGHIDNEGHAHLYIDGVKIGRMYSNVYHVGDLEEGEHEIRITLNTNDHKDYSVDGQVIEASVTVVDMHHDGEETEDHSHAGDSMDHNENDVHVHPDDEELLSN